MRNNKGFTLIEIVVAVAIMSMIGIALSFIVSTASRYYVNSENLKNTSDTYYQDVLDTSDSSNKKATLSFEANGNTHSIDDLSYEKKSTTVDDVNISYLSFVNTKKVASLNGEPVTDTVTDRLRFRNSQVGQGNNKGAWNKSVAGTYKLGDFVTYQDRTYLLVAAKNQQDNEGNYYPPGGQDVSGWQLMDANVPSGSIFTYYLEGDIYIDNGHAYRCKTAMASNNISSSNIEDVGTYNSTTGGITFYRTASAQNARNRWESNGLYLDGHWTNNDVAQ